MAQSKPREKYYEDLSANPSYKEIVNVLSFADQPFDPTALKEIEILNSSIHVVKKCQYGPSNFEFAAKYTPIRQDRFVTNNEANKKKLENLLNELKGFKNLINHENIVNFYGLCIDKEQALVCMELMDFSLKDFYTTFHHAKKPFPEDLVGYIVKSMIQALVICQIHGLNHRMVKPSNIFFNRVKGEIKLGDFGEERILHDSMSSTFSGTLCYWAPERFSTEYDHDNLMYNIGSNVWSLGITLIEIISGELPYKDSKGRITGNIILLQKQIGEFGTKNLEDLLRQMSISDSVKEFIRKCVVTPIKERTYKMIAGTELYTSIKVPYNEVVKKYAEQYEFEKEVLEKRREQDLLKSTVEPKTPDTDPKRVLEQETFSFNVAKVKEVSKISIRNTTEILEGIHELDDRSIAIKKRFFKSRENPQRKKDRFIYEIQVIKKLKNESPFITYMYEYDIKDTEGSLYMELMDMNLKELYLVIHEKEEKFPKQLLECVTVSVVNALSYCHDKNIIHCDVKPTNVLINQHGKIKLTDFDSAIDRDNLDNYDRIGGTMAYWAPDLFIMDKEGSQVTPESQPQFNPKRDIWSLGMTLAEALLGLLPYLEKDDKAPKGYEVIRYVNKIDYAKEFEDCGLHFEEFLEYSHFYKKFIPPNYDISILRFLSTCLQFMKHIPSLIELQKEEFYQACPKNSSEIYTITKEQLKSLQTDKQTTPCSFRPVVSFKNVDGPGPSPFGQIETSILPEEDPKFTLDEEYQRLKLSIHRLLFEIQDFRHLNRDQEIFKEYTKLAHKLYETGKYANIPIYPHFSKTKGLAIIINEFKWMPNRKGDRIGSDRDARNLEELFKAMKFEIYEGGAIVDLEKDEIVKHLKAFVNDKRHMKYDSCIVVIMGHGDDGIIFDIHGEAIDIDHEIWNMFNGDNAQNLVGKPKFFIFQACRGEDSDDGAVVSNHQQEVSKQKLSSLLKYQSGIALKKISNLLLKKSPAHGLQKAPIYSDFFVFYSTVPTMVSYRSGVGSKFIVQIKEVFYKFAHKYDLEDMATIIKGRVGSQQIKIINEEKKEEIIKFQQPQLVTTNSKKYFMFPGVHIE